MKIAQKRAIEKRCIQNIIDHGATVKKSPSEFDLAMGNKFEWETGIGKAAISLDVLCGSKVMSLFVRFVDDTETAQKIFPHWKVNMQLHERVDFDWFVDNHLETITEKIEDYLML